MRGNARGIIISYCTTNRGGEQGVFARRRGEKGDGAGRKAGERGAMGKVMFDKGALFPEKRKIFPGKTVKHDKLFERTGENRTRAVLIPKK